MIMFLFSFECKVFLYLSLCVDGFGAVIEDTAVPGAEEVYHLQLDSGLMWFITCTTV
jgi:hypothetical protein